MLQSEGSPKGGLTTAVLLVFNIRNYLIADCVRQWNSMIQVRLYAAAMAAVGKESVQLEGNYATVADVIAELAQRFPGTTDSGLTLSQVAEQCSFLADGKRIDTSASVSGVETLDVLPPFAGG